MSVFWAGMTVAFAAGCASAGLAVGIAFLLFGLMRMDPAARGAFAFRPLLLPGLRRRCSNVSNAAVCLGANSNQVRKSKGLPNSRACSSDGRPPAGIPARC